MANVVKIKGVQNVLRNLNSEIKKIENRSEAGLLEASLLIKKEAVKQTPVDTGNLRNSAFVIAQHKSPTNPGNFKGKNKEEMAYQHSAVKSKVKDVLKSVKKQHLISTCVGYSANYAAAQHEINYTHMKWDKKSGGYFAVGNWKFLENAIKDNYKNIIKIIARRARIK